MTSLLSRYPVRGIALAVGALTIVGGSIDDADARSLRTRRGGGVQPAEIPNCGNGFARGSPGSGLVRGGCQGIITSETPNASGNFGGPGSGGGGGGGG